MRKSEIIERLQAAVKSHHPRLADAVVNDIRYYATNTTLEGPVITVRRIGDTPIIQTYEGEQDALVYYALDMTVPETDYDSLERLEDAVLAWVRSDHDLGLTMSEEGFDPDLKQYFSAAQLGVFSGRA